MPDPVADFPELAKDFRLAADALVPGHVAAAVALNRDGSRVAVVEYGVWGWVRNGPAIGKWDPPIHVLNFLPKQRGRLRVFDGAGKELFSESLPEEGMFEVGFSRGADEVWCWPSRLVRARHGGRRVAACGSAGPHALSRRAELAHSNGAWSSRMLSRIAPCLRPTDERWSRAGTADLPAGERGQVAAKLDAGRSRAAGVEQRWRVRRGGHRGRTFIARGAKREVGLEQGSFLQRSRRR